MKQSSTVDVEVRYAETDQMGVVHHANYLIWYELARTRFCAESGKSYAEIEGQGYLMIITQAQQDYRLAAFYGDQVRVSCWLDWVASRSLQFGYRVTRGEQILSTGYTKHLWLRRDTMRSCRMPEELMDSYLRLAGQEGFRSAEKV